MCMSRTNIDLPDDLIQEIMHRFDLPTKKSAVELALRRLLEQSDQLAIVTGAFGAGWDGDLDEIRRFEHLS